MKRFFMAMMLLAFVLGIKAQENAPQLEYVVELKVAKDGKITKKVK